MKDPRTISLLILTVVFAGTFLRAEFPSEILPTRSTLSAKLDEKMATMKNACAPDIQKYCKGKPANEVWPCLKGSKDKLTADCKASVPDKM